MVSGLRVAREIGAADALASLRDKELFPGSEVQTGDALRAHLWRGVSSYTNYQAPLHCRFVYEHNSIGGPGSGWDLHEWRHSS